MAQEAVMEGQVAVSVTLWPYVIGFGEIDRDVGEIIRVPKVAVGITPDGG